MIDKYPLLTRFLHWITALLVIMLFTSGWYMVELDYYSSWYQTLPELHYAGGVLLLLLWFWVLLRLFSKQQHDFNFNKSHKPFERFASKWVKRLFYLLVTVMVSTGYLMATGQGEPMILFEIFKLPAVSHFSASQIDTMGMIHEYVSYTLIVLVFIHASGAIKHHLIDKDNTLKHMI